MREACFVFPLLLVTTLAAFDHNVVPSCGPDEKICEFRWTLDKLETMVYYNHSNHKGYPLLVRDGKINLRDPDQCDKYKPISEEELRETFTSDGVHRYVYTINHQFPGPSIVVYEGQQVVVRVTNALLQEGTTIHWHGMYQRRTNYMDGTGSVTQCPINPGETFTYRFLAQPAGTHWYHSHYGLQRTDGLSGALIVLPRPTNQTTTTGADKDTVSDSASHPKFPDNTKDDGENVSTDKEAVTEATGEVEQEHGVQTELKFDGDFVFLVHDWFHEDSDDIFVSYYYEIAQYLWDGYNNTDMCHTRTQQLDGGEVGTIPFQSALINGRGQYVRHYQEAIKVDPEKFEVTAGGNYRFRVINSGMNFAMNISIDMHMLYIISSDGMDLKEVVADYLIVHAGERYDFYIKANQEPSAYLIRTQTMETTQGNIAEWDLPYSMVSPGGTTAVLQYSGVPDAEPIPRERDCTAEQPCNVINCPFKEFPEMANKTCTNFNDLRSKEPNSIGKTTGIEEHFLNFHFPRGIGDILRSQLNGIQFQAPDTPPTVSNGAIYMNGCDLEACDKEACHCTYQINVTRGSEVLMVLTSTVTDIGWQGLPATVHPVHLHGHHFQVLKTGYAVLDPVHKRYQALNPDIRCTNSRCNRLEWSDPAWNGGHIPGINDLDPPLKDTVTVPVGGYVVIRFAADNPGWWIMHCHVELHQVEGMALIVQEGEPEDMTTPPKNFPTCGWFDWSAEEFEKKINGAGSITGSVNAVLTLAVGVILQYFL